MRDENAQNSAAGNVTPSFRLESIYNQGANREKRNSIYSTPQTGRRYVSPASRPGELDEQILFVKNATKNAASQSSSSSTSSFVLSQSSSSSTSSFVLRSDQKQSIKMNSSGSGYDKSVRGQIMAWFECLSQVLARKEHRRALEPSELIEIMQNNGLEELWDIFFDMTRNVDKNKTDTSPERLMNRTRRCSGLLQLICKNINPKASGFANALSMELRTRGLSREGEDILHNIIGTPTARTMRRLVNNAGTQKERINDTLKAVFDRGNRKIRNITSN